MIKHTNFNIRQEQISTTSILLLGTFSKMKLGHPEVQAESVVDQTLHTRQNEPIKKRLFNA